jgi:DNA-binding IclR family transcriptional regulator
LPQCLFAAQLQRELGSQTLSSPEVRTRLGAIKDGVLKNGYGWLKEHFVENIRGAAAPIFDSQGALVAVLAIAGPDGQNPSVQILVQAAAQVSEHLCYQCAESIG